MSTNRRNVKSAKDVHAAHTLACVGNWGVTKTRRKGPRHPPDVAES
jgi:hypothetical protein